MMTRMTPEQRVIVKYLDEDEQDQFKVTSITLPAPKTSTIAIATTQQQLP
jgi:hypothetical protein